MIVNEIDNYEKQIEDYKKKSKEQTGILKVMNEKHQDELKKLNTIQIASVEDRDYEIAQKKENIQDIKNWMEQETEKTKERDYLEHEYNSLLTKHNNELATIKKERNIAVDHLRKEMLFNIKNVKGQMLTMNEEQLQGTTKLTVK